MLNALLLYSSTVNEKMLKRRTLASPSACRHHCALGRLEFMLLAHKAKFKIYQ